MSNHSVRFTDCSEEKFFAQCRVASLLGSRNAETVLSISVRSMKRVAQVLRNQSPERVALLAVTGTDAIYDTVEAIKNPEEGLGKGLTGVLASTAAAEAGYQLGNRFLRRRGMGSLGAAIPALAGFAASMPAHAIADVVYDRATGG